MRKVKAAIVGCGVISDVYIKSIEEKFSVLDVIACSDLSKEHMERTAKKYQLRPRAYEEILADKEIELILNLTSPAAHYSLTKQAILSGKHVYSEKTMAVEFEDGKTLCRLANEQNVRLGTAPDTFLGGGLQTAKYAIDKELAGRILSGTVSLTRDYRVFGENLPHLFKRGGSVIYDMGCYYLTALCSLLGRVKRIFALGQKSEEVHTVKRVDSPLFGEKLPVEEYNVISAVLEFENQVFVTFHLNGGSICKETFCMELYGEKGILRLGDPNTFGGEVFLQKTGNEPVKLPFTHGFLKESRGLGAAEMAWALLHDRPHRAGKEMGLHVLEVIHGILESADSGQAYKTETTFEIPAALPEGFIGNGFWEPKEESVLL